MVAMSPSKENDNDSQGIEDHLPYRPAISENAETINVRIVCDGSGKQYL